MRRVDSLEKTLMLGGIGGRRRSSLESIHRNLGINLQFIGSELKGLSYGVIRVILCRQDKPKVGKPVVGKLIGYNLNGT